MLRPGRLSFGVGTRTASLRLALDDVVQKPAVELAARATFDVNAGEFVPELTPVRRRDCFPIGGPAVLVDDAFEHLDLAPVSGLPGVLPRRPVLLPGEPVGHGSV